MTGEWATAAAAFAAVREYVEFLERRQIAPRRQEREGIEALLRIAEWGHASDDERRELHGWQIWTDAGSFCAGCAFHCGEATRRTGLREVREASVVPS